MADCPICLEELTEETIKKLDCNHSFHINCIDIWIETKRSCPICRHIIYVPPVELIPIVSSNYKKKIINYLIFTCILLHFIFIFYNVSTIFETNNYINSIIIYKNETELNGHSNKTNFPIYYLFFSFVYFWFFNLLFICIYNISHTINF